jgi:hypothetical protein
MKQNTIIIQIFECILIPLDILKAFYKGYREGRWKHGFGNATVELRRRYSATFVYPWSVRNYFLHRLGVTLMDPFGKHMKMWYGEGGFKYRSPNAIYTSETQYLHSWNPNVRKIIRKYIDHALVLGKSYRA